MTKYIDGYIFPILKEHLNEYMEAAEKIAKIWKEYGALSYVECIMDEQSLEGTRSFSDILKTSDDETVIFGWLTFDSNESRDHAHKKVSEDPRMNKLVAPLIDPSRVIFDAQKMVFGGFKTVIH